MARCLDCDRNPELGLLCPQHWENVSQTIAGRWGPTLDMIQPDTSLLTPMERKREAICADWEKRVCACGCGETFHIQLGVRGGSGRRYVERSHGRRVVNLRYRRKTGECSIL
jgi:hypothetical protein